jgi:hypothetical protein
MEHFHCGVVVVIVADESVAKVYDDMGPYEMKTLVVPLNQQYHQVNSHHVWMVQIEQKKDVDVE